MQEAHYSMWSPTFPTYVQMVIADTQLDVIHRLCNVIASVLACPTTLPQKPMQHSLCAALLERLGITRTTDATGTQYKIEFQYNTTAFTVTIAQRHSDGFLQEWTPSFWPSSNWLALNPCASGLLPCLLGIPGKRQAARLNQSRQLWHVPRTHLFKCDSLLPQFQWNDSLTSSADATKCLINQTIGDTPHQSAPNCRGPSAAGRCIARGVSPCLPNQQTIYWWHRTVPCTSMLEQPLCDDCIPHEWEPHSTISVWYGACVGGSKALKK